MSIIYPTDFLNSLTRAGQLYELTISLGLPITEIGFRGLVSSLNTKFVLPRAAFSGTLKDKKISLFYSTNAPMSQREIVLGIEEAFSPYEPEIDFEQSEGEVPGVPLVTPREEVPILSLDWLKKSYQEIVASISQKTGLPTWTILPIAGSLLILLVVAIKTKPVVIIKK